MRHHEGVVIITGYAVIKQYLWHCWPSMVIYGSVFHLLPFQSPAMVPKGACPMLSIRGLCAVSSVASYLVNTIGQNKSKYKLKFILYGFVWDEYIALFVWLISRTFSVNEQYFSFTTNQPTILSGMAYQPSEQGNECLSGNRLFPGFLLQCELLPPFWIEKRC